MDKRTSNTESELAGRKIWRSERVVLTSSYLRSQRSLLYRPPTDVYETETSVVVRVEIPGVRSEDFDISLNDQILTIAGIRTDSSERRAYHQMEIHFGEFLSETALPVAVDQTPVEAIYTDGFLKLVFTKLQDV